MEPRGTVIREGVQRKAAADLLLITAKLDGRGPQGYKKLVGTSPSEERLKRATPKTDVWNEYPGGRKGRGYSANRRRKKRDPPPLVPEEVLGEPHRKGGETNDRSVLSRGKGRDTNSWVKKTKVRAAISKKKSL